MYVCRYVYMCMYTYIWLNYLRVALLCNDGLFRRLSEYPSVVPANKFASAPQVCSTVLEVRVYVHQAQDLKIGHA